MNDIAVKETDTSVSRPMTSAFANNETFEAALRMGNMLSKSKLVPNSFQGDVANCVIALEMANRLGASPLAIMQNLYVVHGNPSWSAQYVIAAVNTSGKFSPMRFIMDEDNCEIANHKGLKNRTCQASCIELSSGEVLTGPTVSIAMAVQEGWYDKKGSKWQTMPDLMLRYRAATFFGRLYAPELMMGMKTVEEAEDIGLNTVDSAGNVVETRTSSSTAELNAALNKAKEQTPGEDDSAHALAKLQHEITHCTERDDLDQIMDRYRETITNPQHRNLAGQMYAEQVERLETIE